jgi:peptide/nickel transport system substrate-binding protein
MRRRTVGVVAAATALALAVTACSKPTPAPTQTEGFNAAVGQVYNASDYKGGTLTFAVSSDWDSVDPGDTYYGLSWNLVRLYSRSLVMFKPQPGKAGNELTPDLAQSLGTPSDGGKTWTYKLRSGLKFEDGTPITSKDVKYAVLRSLDSSVLKNGVGPYYMGVYLDLEPGYVGPYTTPNIEEKTAIETPDDQTIVFHLKQPFGGFDYFAMLPVTAPVPQAKDKGALYKEHVVSSGPYMFASYESGKGFTLTRNPNWDQSTDPNRQALPDGYNVKIGLKADDIDQQIANGTIDVDLAGTGVQSAMLPQVLDEGNPLHARGDNPGSARLWYTSIIGTVAPLDNVHCRKAIEYAADRTGYQTAYGGPFAGGDINTSVLVPPIPGYKQIDPYPSTDHKGDVDKANDELNQCGQPNGFSTTMAYRSDRPKEEAVAESLQQSLSRVGINLTLQGIPTGDYFSSTVGVPSYVVEHKIGLATNGWAADWNDGYGMLGSIVDSRLINPNGGSSNLSVRDPDVDALVDQALGSSDAAAREGIWAQVDAKVMDDAYILPGVWSKAVTLRSKNAANIFVNEAFGQYDYLTMSVAPPA